MVWNVAWHRSRRLLSHLAPAPTNKIRPAITSGPFLCPTFKSVKLGEPRPSLSVQTYGIRNLPAGVRCPMLDSQAARSENRAQRAANHPARPRPAQQEPPSMNREPRAAQLSRLVSCGSCATKRNRLDNGAYLNWLGSLPISGHKPYFLDEMPNAIFRGPRADQTGARAMFLTNIYIKFDLRYNYLIKQYIIP